MRRLIFGHLGLRPEPLGDAWLGQCLRPGQRKCHAKVTEVAEEIYGIAGRLDRFLLFACLVMRMRSLAIHTCWNLAFKAKRKGTP